MATRGVQNAALLLGKTIKLSRIGINQIPCVHVRCQENDYNNYLKMYFAHSLDFWALDKDGLVGLGDLVLIRPVSAADRIGSTITHSVDRVIMKYGSIIDPVTKKRIIQGDFLERHELRKKLVESAANKSA